MSDIQELTKFRDYLSLRVQPGTVTVYMNALQMWFGWFASNNGGSQTAATAQSYIDSLAKAGKAPSTISTRAHAIMRYFKWKGITVRLDCPTIRIGEPEYLSMKEFETVLKACESSLEKVLVVVLFDTAIRISELLNLDMADIDRENGLIGVTRKGGRLEMVNISDKALAELDAWVEVRKSKSKRVFMDLEYYDAWRIIKKLGKKTGIKMHPHILRHSRAIQMLMNGATLHDVQLHLGHKSSVTTANIYGRFKAIDTKSRIPSW